MNDPGEAALVICMPGMARLVPSSPALERVDVQLDRFDNQELHVRLARSVEGLRCFVVGSLSPPDSHLVELLLTCDTAARGGARSVHAVLPYLAYARQDRPEPGASLAAAWIGRLLAASGVSDVLTVDIHSEAAREMMGLPVASLSPAPLLAAALAPTLRADTTVVAPDAGAIPRATAAATALGIERPVAWTEKRRAPKGIAHGRLVGELSASAIIVDDILDTGATLVSCCQELRAGGVTSVSVAVTHGLFTGGRWRALPELGVEAVHTTDTVPSARRHSSESVHVHRIAPLLEQFIADAARHGAEPVRMGTP